TLEDLQTLRECPVEEVTIDTAKGRDIAPEHDIDDDTDAAEQDDAAPPAEIAIAHQGASAPVAVRKPATRTETAVERERAARIISSSKS
ncbi:DUF3391 domain-containing protein, partial [Acinetobacter baumannii]